MRRGPTGSLSLRERVGVRGRKSRSRPSGPYTCGVMPVLPGPMRSEILHFALRGSGEPQNDRRGGGNVREGSIPAVRFTHVVSSVDS